MLIFFLQSVCAFLVPLNFVRHINFEGDLIRMEANHYKHISNLRITYENDQLRFLNVLWKIFEPTNSGEPQHEQNKREFKPIRPH